MALDFAGPSCLLSAYSLCSSFLVVGNFPGTQMSYLVTPLAWVSILNYFLKIPERFGVLVLSFLCVGNRFEQSRKLIRKGDTVLLGGCLFSDNKRTLLAP